MHGPTCTFWANLTPFALQEPKLLTFCKMVVQELQMPPAGDYVRNALKGQEFYKGSQVLSFS